MSRATYKCMFQHFGRINVAPRCKDSEPAERYLSLVLFMASMRTDFLMSMVILENNNHR